MKFQFSNYKTLVQSMRLNGKTFSQINNELGLEIPKSTMSDWCRDLVLEGRFLEKLENSKLDSLRSAWDSNAKKRKLYLESLFKKNETINEKLLDKQVMKLLLAMLFWGEGSKSGGRLTFANSDPNMVKFYLKLLRKAYKTDESKFRCTLQCRADQDVEKLEVFWSNITDIPKNKFYKARIDRRTIGKITKKFDYKGVCVLDYFSADIFNELKVITQIVSL